MSSLNEACGDGRFISPPEKDLLDTIGESELLNLTPTEWKDLEEERNREGAFFCAQEVAKRYEGTRCLGTTIHAHVPNPEDCTHSFYFDEDFLLACHQTGSKVTRESLPGSGYFKYLSEKEKELFRRYKNALEGHRPDMAFRCPHPVERIPAPVPNIAGTDKQGNWHYFDLDKLPAKYTNVTSREVDDFNPVVQLNKLINSKGMPNVHVYKDNEGNICAEDKNKTWQKICADLPQFVANFTGADLKAVVKERAEELYVQLLKKAANKLERFHIKLNKNNLCAIQTGALKLKIVKAKK